MECKVTKIVELERLVKETKEKNEYYTKISDIIQEAQD